MKIGGDSHTAECVAQFAAAGYNLEKVESMKNSVRSLGSCYLNVRSCTSKGGLASPAKSREQSLCFKHNYRSRNKKSNNRMKTT